MKKELYPKYAKLLLKMGVNLQKGQILYLQCATENREIALEVTKQAFEMGAKDVVIEWNDPEFNHLRATYADEATLREVPAWKTESVDYYMRQGACQLGISTTYPDLMSDVEPAKAKAIALAGNDVRNVIRQYIHKGILQWTGTCLPNPQWAKKVYPHLDEDEAYLKLTENILEMMRISEDNDPIIAWQEHYQNLLRRAKWLNEKQFDSVHITTEIGTDIEIGLVKNHIWTSAADMGAPGIPPYFANMPTEEVFTDPDKYNVNGVAVASFPLNMGGKIVENFAMTFENGKCVKATADKNVQNLLDTINQSESSGYLGEVALVSKQSPITKMGVIFYNGLIDENAACHLALGSSFPTNIQGGTTMTKEELDQHGVNVAVNHNDFMIGTPHMKVVGKYKDGTEIVIMDDGDFVI